MKELARSIRNYNEDNYKEIIDSIVKVGFKNVFIQWYDEDLQFSQQQQLDLCKKLGLSTHDTNISIYIRNLYHQMQR